VTAGPRGPALMQDVHLIEKPAHFNRERIPERVAHVDGIAARRDAVGKAAPGQDVVAGQGVVASDAARLADAHDVRERMVQLLDTLSNEERKVLTAEVWRRAKEAKREYLKYALPTDRKLQALDKLGGELKLTDVQRAQVEALKEAFKPRTEAAMQDVWTRGAEVGQRVRDLWEAGEREAATALKVEEGIPLREEAAQIQAELDAQYNARWAVILTPEQIEEMAKMPEPSGRGGK